MVWNKENDRSRTYSLMRTIDCKPQHKNGHDTQQIDNIISCLTIAGLLTKAGVVTKNPLSHVIMLQKHIKEL